MGCCITTPNSMQHQNDLKNHQPRSSKPKPNETLEIQSRAPPPQPVEEESVKEVLSETPISKPHQVPILMAEMNTQMPNMQPRRKGATSITNKACSMSERFSEEISQISETCSINASFSTATTTATVTEKREDEATSKRRTREGTHNRKRSYTIDGNRIGGREQRRPKSPARMPEKKIPACSRSAIRRDSGQVHRDPGEGSRRRSRSPASVRTKNTAGVVRRQMKSPAGGAGRWLPPGKCVEKENVGEVNDVVPQEESVENPHVSLECFIFL